MKSVADALVSYLFSFLLGILHRDNGGQDRNPHTQEEACAAVELALWDSLAKTYAYRMRLVPWAGSPVLVEFT